MTTAAIYARKSDDNPENVESQIKDAAAFIAKQGWARGPAFSDTDISGAKFERPGLKALLAAIKTQPRPFEILAVADASRLGRDIAHTLILQRTLVRAGLRIFHFHDGSELRLDTPTQEFVASVANFGHQDYLFQTGIRTAIKLREKARHGFATGQQIFGYRTEWRGEKTEKRPHGTHKERVINRDEAEVVRRVFTLAASGLGYHRIVRALGGSSSKNQIKTMLGQQLYRGLLIFGKKKTEHGLRVPVPEGEWVRTPMEHLRLVDDDLWDRAQARLAATRQHYVRTADGRLNGKLESGLVSRFILNGIARCGTCGGALSKAGSGQPRYYCTRRAQRGDDSICTNRHGVLVEDLDRAVLACVHGMLADDPGAVADLIEQRDKKLRAEYAATSKPKDVAKEIKTLTAEIKRLVAAVAKGTASASVTAAIAEREARVKALRAAPPAVMPFDRAAFLRTFAGTRRIDMLLDRTRPAEVRQVLRKIGVTSVPVAQTATGWSFAGEVDLAALLEALDSPVRKGRSGSPGRAAAPAS